MTEQELRALVREALARYVGASPSGVGARAQHVGANPSGVGASPNAVGASARNVGASSRGVGGGSSGVGASSSGVGASSGHPSHGLFMIPDGSAADGPCIIEPAVSCNHCGYCKSYGH